MLDMSLRTISLAAIFLPLWLFYMQQNAESIKQKSLFQLNIYSNTLPELHSFLNKPIGSLEFEQAANKILYEVYPRLVLLNDKHVKEHFQAIKLNTQLSLLLSNSFMNADALEIIVDSILSLVNQKGITNYPTACEFFKSNHQIKTNLESNAILLDQLKHQDALNKNLLPQKIIDRTSTMLKKLIGELLNFNNNVYVNQPIYRLDDIMNLRDEITQLKNDYRSHHN